MDISAIKSLYSEIIEKERAINPKWTKVKMPTADEIYNIAWRLYFVIAQAFVPRSAIRYLTSGNAKRASQMFESVSAHTNLVSNMVHYALNYQYGADFGVTKDGYSLSQILEVVTRHDLPEVFFGDIPDDNTRDEAKKIYEESLFHQDYSTKGLLQHHHWERQVDILLQEFTYLNSPSGRLIYSGDKVSAILLALGADDQGLDLRLYTNSPLKRYRITPSDKSSAEIIDGGISKSYLISELWTVSHFKTRKFIDFDDTGFMTCLLIMYTLKVHGKWYPWREADYPK